MERYASETVDPTSVREEEGKEMDKSDYFKSPISQFRRKDSKLGELQLLDDTPILPKKLSEASALSEEGLSI